MLLNFLTNNNFFRFKRNKKPKNCTYISFFTLNSKLETCGIFKKDADMSSILTT